MQEELARRLAAAYMSHQLGIGMDYTMKTHLKGRPVGAFWLEVARLVQDRMLERQTTAQETRARMRRAMRLV